MAFKNRKNIFSHFLLSELNEIWHKVEAHNRAAGEEKKMWIGCFVSFLFSVLVKFAALQKCPLGLWGRQTVLTYFFI